MKFPELKELPTQELVDRLTAALKSMEQRLVDEGERVLALESEVNALEVERDTLAAQVTQLRQAAITAHNAHSDFYEGQKFVCTTIMSTPKQCLAERDAEVAAKAVETFGEDLRVEFIPPPGTTTAAVDYYKAAIRLAIGHSKDFANQLRQAAKGGE
jgi:hypothetical protein